MQILSKQNDCKVFLSEKKLKFNKKLWLNFQHFQPDEMDQDISCHQLELVGF